MRIFSSFGAALVLGSLTFLTPSSVSAAVVIPPPPSVAAKGFILMDYQTGKVIAEQNADMQLAPASLTK